MVQMPSENRGLGKERGSIAWWLSHGVWTQCEWLESLFIHLLTARSWVSYLNSLYLSFYICKIGLLIVLIAKEYDGN